MSESFGGLMTAQGFAADSPARWAQVRKDWVGKRCTVTIEKETRHKTLPQLGYFMGPIVEEFMKHTGYEHDECYLELWRAWGGIRVVVCKLTGEEIVEKPRISDYTSEEMSALISRCIKEGNLMGITFPDPDTWRG